MGFLCCNSGSFNGFDETSCICDENRHVDSLVYLWAKHLTDSVSLFTFSSSMFLNIPLIVKWIESMSCRQNSIQLLLCWAPCDPLLPTLGKYAMQAAHTARRLESVAISSQSISDKRCRSIAPWCDEEWLAWCSLHIKSTVILHRPWLGHKGYHNISYNSWGTQGHVLQWKPRIQCHVQPVSSQSVTKCKTMLTFCENSGSHSKVTSCEITVVLSCRESSGNWDENASSLPVSKCFGITGVIFTTWDKDQRSPRTLKTFCPTVLLVGPCSKRITCWVHKTQLEVNMSVPHWVMTTSSKRAPSALQNS